MVTKTHQREISRIQFLSSCLRTFTSSAQLLSSAFLFLLGARRQIKKIFCVFNFVHLNEIALFLLAGNGFRWWRIRLQHL